MNESRKNEIEKTESGSTDSAAEKSPQGATRALLYIMAPFAFVGELLARYTISCFGGSGPYMAVGLGGIASIFGIIVCLLTGGSLYHELVNNQRWNLILAVAAVIPVVVLEFLVLLMMLVSYSRGALFTTKNSAIGAATRRHITESIKFGGILIAIAIGTVLTIVWYFSMRLLKGDL